jgi:hypothetical protein
MSFGLIEASTREHNFYKNIFDNDLHFIKITNNNQQIEIRFCLLESVCQYSK